MKFHRILVDVVKLVEVVEDVVVVSEVVVVVAATKNFSLL